MPVSKDKVRALSSIQREYLIRHIDHPVPVHVHNSRTIYPLIASGLLVGNKSYRPSETKLTSEGRSAVAAILAAAADALISAGMIDSEIAVQVANKIKARRDSAKDALTVPQINLGSPSL